MPDPDPLERYDLSHPAVPPTLDGFTILHITDGHVRTPQGRDPAFRRLLSAIGSVRPDLVALTGDFMTEPGDEPHALDALERVLDAIQVRYDGAPRILGVFGNHDSHAFKVAARSLGRVTWVENRIEPVRDDLVIVGASYPEDLFGAVVGGEEGPWATGHRPSSDARRDRVDERMASGLPDQTKADGRWPMADSGPQADAASPAGPFSLVLSHYPTEIFPAAELGLPMMLAGHTHGGQIRISKGRAPHTSSDFPSHLATGIIRLRNTVCAVSRGVGEAFIGVRVNCPRQLPLYTLKRGEAPRSRFHQDGEYLTVTQTLAW